MSRVDVTRARLVDPSWCATIADAVRRGQAVRIIGLGMLTCQLVSRGSAPDIGAEPFRITLTAAEAKHADHRNDGAWFMMVNDTRHIARALGAPVEVWSPSNARSRMTTRDRDLGGVSAERITVVQP